jgi:glycogen debranching enzyme
MDEHLWDDAQGLWLDLAVVGGGDSVDAPTLDGVFGALATADPDRAHRVLDQLLDPQRFGSSYGLRYLPRDHPAYDANEYWRGPAWPPLNYMAHVAARRWDRADVADAIKTMSLRGATRSKFAEYWNAENGAGRGARPQGWATLAATYRSQQA